MKHDRSETTVVNKKTTGMVDARAESSGVETRGGRRKRNASMLFWFPRLKRVSSIGGTDEKKKFFSWKRGGKEKERKIGGGRKRKSGRS